MDAEQLWETTLDPSRRRLRWVQIDELRPLSRCLRRAWGQRLHPVVSFIFEKGGELFADMIDV